MKHESLQQMTTQQCICVDTAMSTLDTVDTVLATGLNISFLSSNETIYSVLRFWKHFPHS